jgi:2-desacetyl-2-hydroxyethyl bacteriochlorophyllide A dehydrogenase
MTMPTKSTLMTKALYFIEPRRVEVREEVLSEPGPGDVVIETLASGISAGTEMNVYRGLAPQWRKRQDRKTGLFVVGEEPDWSYPSRYGYASVGRILECGSEVRNFQPGELVFAFSPHGDYAVVPAERAVPLGTLLAEPEVGIFFANLSTAYNGVLDAHPPLGATVVVIGLGVIGQLVIQLVSRTGPGQLIAADVIDNRRALGRLHGATQVIDPSREKLAESVRELTNGRGADVVIEASGSANAFNEAIRTVGYNGLVVAMSWYGGSFETLDLSSEFHHNRPRIVSSQVAALNPYLGPLWTVGRRTDMVSRYLTELDFSHLVTHRVPLQDAPAAYELLDQHPEQAMQVVFRYREDS